MSPNNNNNFIIIIIIIIIIVIVIIIKNYKRNCLYLVQNSKKIHKLVVRNIIESDIKYIINILNMEL